MKMNCVVVAIIVLAASLTTGCAPKSDLTITRLALPSDTLFTGTNGMTGVKFRALATGEDARIKKFTVKVFIHDETPSIPLKLCEFWLTRNGFPFHPSEYTILDGRGNSIEHLLSPFGEAYLSVASLGGTDSEATTNIVVVFADFDSFPPAGDGSGEEEILSDGNSNTYEVKFTAVNANMGSPMDSDFISFQLLGDEEVAPGNLAVGSEEDVVGLSAMGVAKSANFIWSDYSAPIGSHDSSIPSTSMDWWSGSWVQNLPLDPWVLRR